MDVTAFACLRNVTLFGPFLTENLFHQLVSQHLFHEYLCIGDSKALEKIKISTDTIKKLHVVELCNLVEAEISAPVVEKL